MGYSWSDDKEDEDDKGGCGLKALLLFLIPIAAALAATLI